MTEKGDSKMREICHIFLGVQLIPLLLFGQMTEDDQISLHGDFARFRAQEGWNYVEMYFSIPRERLKYELKDETYVAQFKLGVEIFLGDSLVSRESWQNVDRIDSLGAIQGQELFDQFSTFLNEGMYHVRVTITDLEHAKTGLLEMDLPIQSFSSDSLEMGDIQMALRIVPDRNKSKFVKNGYNILPNPHRVYGPDWPILYYYCEIYNLSPLKGSVDSTYIVNIKLLDMNQHVIRSLPPKIRKRQGSSAVEVGSAVVANLVSGTYVLYFDVIDVARADTVSQEKSFLIYRPSDFADEEQPFIEDRITHTDESFGMTESELDILFEKLQYIADKDEKKLYKNFDLEGKKKFMVTFWRKRDPDLFTEVNEIKQEYFRRLAFADAEFSFGTTKGWQSDEGRIYIIYGEPDQIDRYPNTMGQRPFQVWYYHNIENGIEFVYVDKGGFGDLELVHSTARNEIKDYEWQEKWLK